jgi:predicted DNA-binding mobile mystery protein A
MLLKSGFDRLLISQLDRRLATLRSFDLPSAPPIGWVRSIRNALGMTATALGRRLSMTSGGVRKLENAEAEEAITLATLRKMADSLDCELRYVLVPRKPLQVQLNDRARELATTRLRLVEQTMSLEDQAVVGDAKELQIDLLAQSYLNGPRRDFW